jgi:rfaE bifunctional protein nucleotidyltransferase chain/domain
VAGAVAAASAFVAAGGAASVRVGRPSPAAGAVRETADQLVARVRAAGGTVVATGGCFDLLHAGHVTVLAQARALGDCLVVLLNSDDSVRRLKGESRPLQTQADRATVLSALEHVDAVVVFDEDTPVSALERLRPDVWAKGGDYALADLPEAPGLEQWGGQAVVLPYLSGKSTSALIRKQPPVPSPSPVPDLGTVLVTGAASGLGAATVAAVRDAGGRPIALDRVPVDGVPHEVVDLSDTRAAEEAVRRLVDGAGGTLDGVVTCAGTDKCGPLDGVDGADWDRVVMVNLLGTAAVVRAAPALPQGQRQRPRSSPSPAPRPPGLRRRDRLLRQQVRRRRPHPRACRPSSRARSASRCSPRAA